MNDIFPRFCGAPDLRPQPSTAGTGAATQHTGGARRGERHAVTRACKDAVVPTQSAVDGVPVPALAARDVTRRYGDGVVALDGVSLEVARGECVALVGESGAGKSTLLRCFNRLSTVDSGHVAVEGEDVQDLDPVALRRRIGYVPQEGGLLPHWTVERNVSLVPWLQGRQDARAAGRAALVRVGLDPDVYGPRLPRELSGGQRQRVALARAVAGSPSIVLLDEPFGALDALTRADVQAMFDTLRRSSGVAALLVTHDLQEAVQLADRVAVMRGGRIEQIDTAERLIAAPATPYVESLLARQAVGRGAAPGDGR